jgi:hypothetical protein
LFDFTKLGGVFAWGLGEDAPDFTHLRAVNEGLESIVDSQGSHDRKEL